MSFRLRYLQHDFELPPGRFLIGRSMECQLSLDDPLVSRKHALLVVTSEHVEVHDLGSRNGVVVNGEKVDGKCKLGDGDRILIGAQELVLKAPVGSASSRPRVPSVEPHGSETITSMQPVRLGDGAIQLRTPGDNDEVAGDQTGTSKCDAFRLLGGVADKALALGRSDEAERLLSSLLKHVIDSLRGGSELDQTLIEQAGLYGARLAAGTGKAQWVNYVVELFCVARRPCSGPVIDELHVALRRVKTVDAVAFRAYVRMLRQESSAYGPADKFLLQRIEGLERVVAG